VVAALHHFGKFHTDALLVLDSDGQIAGLLELGRAVEKLGF
jgi:hypothetical protein